jgi:hypothetical protein
MDSSSSLIKSLTGSFFWLVILWSLWIGYQIGKEAKTNWFSEKPQQESSIVEKKIAHTDTQQIDSNKD